MTDDTMAAAVKAAAEALHVANCRVPGCHRGGDGWTASAEAAVTAAVAHLLAPVEVEVEVAHGLTRSVIAAREHEVERLGAMVEWFAELVVDAREACQRAESIEPQGSPDWVASGIAMRKTALREVRQILDRERTTDPSRYDRMKAERDEALRERDEAVAAERRRIAAAIRAQFVGQDHHEPTFNSGRDAGLRLAARIAEGETSTIRDVDPGNAQDARRIATDLRERIAQAIDQAWAETKDSAAAADYPAYHEGYLDGLERATSIARFVSLTGDTGPMSADDDTEEATR